MGGGGVGGVQYCPVLMLNNEPHTADNGYYCAQGWIYFSRDLFLEMQQDLLVSTPSLVSLKPFRLETFQEKPNLMFVYLSTSSTLSRCFTHSTNVSWKERNLFLEDKVIHTVACVYYIIHMYLYSTYFRLWLWRVLKIPRKWDHQRKLSVLSLRSVGGAK